MPWLVHPIFDVDLVGFVNLVGVLSPWPQVQAHSSALFCRHPLTVFPHVATSVPHSDIPSYSCITAPSRFSASSPKCARLFMFGPICHIMCEFALPYFSSVHRGGAYQVHPLALLACLLGFSLSCLIYG